MMPEPMIAATHWPAASQELKPSITGRAAAILGMIFSVASVTMPN
jgi:hypothetical protein